MLNSTTVVLLLVAIISSSCSEIASNEKNDKPNIIIIFTDDQGYQDVGVFGSPNIETPNLDQMAKEGARLTNFYAAKAV